MAKKVRSTLVRPPRKESLNEANKTEKCTKIKNNPALSDTNKDYKIVAAQLKQSDKKLCKSINNT